MLENYRAWIGLANKWLVVLNNDPYKIKRIWCE